MKILITGGTGYLAGRLINFFLKDSQYDISIISRKSNNLKFNNVNFVKIDWENNNYIYDACKNIDVIIHLAGMNYNDCKKNLKKAIDVNVKNTTSLLKMAEKCNVKQFIYISTIHVYGENLSGIVDENTKLNPVGNYAITKEMAEKEILNFSQNSNIKTIILRLSNAFGAPYNIEADCWSLLFNDLCKQLIQNKKIIIKSNGKQKRNFISINEFCKAVRELISYFKYQKKNEIFNLGSSWTPSILEVTKLITKLYKIKCKVDNVPIVIEDNKQEKQQHNFEFKSDRIKKVGINVMPDASEEIEKLINFCKHNFQ